MVVDEAFADGKPPPSFSADPEWDRVTVANRADFTAGMESLPV